MKNLLSSNSKVNRVNSENGDLQFDSTGNELIDLIAKAPIRSLNEINLNL